MFLERKDNTYDKLLKRNNFICFIILFRVDVTFNALIGNCRQMEHIDPVGMDF